MNSQSGVQSPSPGGEGSFALIGYLLARPSRTVCTKPWAVWSALLPCVAQPWHELRGCLCAWPRVCPLSSPSLLTPAMFSH